MTTPESPGWRNPVLWLVIALPLGAMIAGIGLVITAIRTDGNDSIADPVRRIGEIQISDTTPDTHARALGLAAVLRSQDGMLEILPVGGSFNRNMSLRLQVLHPVRAADDSNFVLKPDSTGWRVPHSLATDHDWNLQLTSADGSWRLMGRLPKGGHAAYLQSAIGAR